MLAEGGGTVNPARLPVGRQIKHYWQKNGNRSASVIAGLCGISERYLQMIEAGKKVPSADVLSRLAAELASKFRDGPPTESVDRFRTVG